MNTFQSIFKRPCMGLFLFVFFIVNQGLSAQPTVKNINANLKNHVMAECSDSLGNLYVAVIRSDTGYINQYNVVSKTWSVYCTFPQITSVYGLLNITTCDMFYGKLYISGFDYKLTYSKIYIFEFSNGKWSKNAILNNSVPYTGYNVLKLATVKYNNRLYYAGTFDSINSMFLKSIVSFDGSSYTQEAYPNVTLFTPNFSVNSDSLYLTTGGSSVYLMTATKSWFKYYSLPLFNSIYSMAFQNATLHLCTYDRIQMVRNGITLDSILIPNGPAGTLRSFNKKIYLAVSRKDTNCAVYYLNNQNKLTLLFKNSARDTINDRVNDTGYVSLYNDDKHLYYFATGGVKVGSNKYNYIVEIKDSITPITYDTIRGYVFWDKNNNYVKDGNDVWPKSGWVRNINGNYSIPLGNNNGTFQDLVDENIVAEYSVVAANYDSCLRTLYTGSIQSKNKQAGITRDTVQLPLGRPTLAQVNYVVTNQSQLRARLSTSTQLTVNVLNHDCSGANYSNGVVTVKLDSNTILNSSIPAYSSKNGNTYTFSGLSFNYFQDNKIKLLVTYPNTKYTIGQKVKHVVKLGTISGEDTIGNMDSIVQMMFYSFDPNVKHSLPEGKITKELKSIRYYINFQNLGNDDAYTVRVVDTLETKMPVYEFRMIAASHPYKVSLQPSTGIVTWLFEDIKLKPKSTDEEGSKGYVIFEAKVRGDLRVGDSIRNKASIYFDYNDPVITNFAVISMVKIDPPPPPNNISKINTQSKTLTIYPNPTHIDLSLENTDSKLQTIRVFDMNGKWLQTLSIAPAEVAVLSTQNWKTGLYFILSDSGESFKIIKE